MKSTVRTVAALQCRRRQTLETRMASPACLCVTACAGFKVRMSRRGLQCFPRSHLYVPRHFPATVVSRKFISFADDVGCSRAIVHSVPGVCCPWHGLQIIPRFPEISCSPQQLRLAIPLAKGIQRIRTDPLIFALIIVVIA